MNAPKPFVAKLFGALEVETEGQSLPRLRSRKGHLLLALLLLRSDMEVARDWLCGVLWIDSTEEKARVSLRQSLNDLRNALGSQAYRVESPTTRTLRFVSAGADIDVLRFDRLLSKTEPTLEELEEAISLYRGTLLEDWRDEILLPEQQSRRLTYLAALERGAERLQAQQDHPQAIRLLQAALLIAPSQESLARGLMRSLTEANRFAECMEVYRELRLHLWEELHVEPHPETVQLYNNLRADVQAQAQTRPIPSRTPVVSGTSPLSLPRPTLPPLPKPLTSLIGREQECAEIEAFLRQSALVTLTGVGGVGKTRLALEIAGRALHKGVFPDGVGFVSLSELQEPEILPAFVARTLQIPTDALRTPLESLTDFLHTRNLLLVLDNCEHLVQASAELVFHLLSHAPELKILATSRIVLGVGGEQVVPLRPLPVPSETDRAESVNQNPAVRLFLERARLVSPHFTLRSAEVPYLVHLMRQLEGIPLALELAAARLKILSLPQITERMSDRFQLLRSTERVGMRPPRAMEDSVRASYQLLRPEIAQIFRTLCLFGGGFRLEMAEELCEREILEPLTSLVESSLVGVSCTEGGEPRYRILETIRQFGIDRLKEAGEYERVVRSHYAVCLRFVEEAREHIIGSEQHLWLERMEAERANCTIALLNAPTNRDFLHLVNMLLRYWFSAGHIHEGRRWFDLALQRLEGVEPAIVARTYNGAGVFAWHQARYQEGKEYLEKSVTLARSLDDKEALANALNNLQLVTRPLADYERAYAVGLEALECYRALGNVWGLARTYSNLGQTAGVLQRYEESKTFYQEGMRLFEELGDPRGIAYIQVSLAETELEQGGYLSARPLLEQGIQTFYALEDWYQLSWCCDVVACYAMALGEVAKATYLHALCTELRIRIGSEGVTACERPRFLTREMLSVQVGQPFYDQAVEECRHWSVEQARDFALGVCGLACVPVVSHRAEEGLGLA